MRMAMVSLAFVPAPLAAAEIVEGTTCSEKPPATIFDAPLCRETCFDLRAVK